MIKSNKILFDKIPVLQLISFLQRFLSCGVFLIRWEERHLRLHLQTFIGWWAGNHNFCDFINNYVSNFYIQSKVIPATFIPYSVPSDSCYFFIQSKVIPAKYFYILPKVIPATFIFSPKWFLLLLYSAQNDYCYFYIQSKVIPATFIFSPKWFLLQICLDLKHIFIVLLIYWKV